MAKKFSVSATALALPFLLLACTGSEPSGATNETIVVDETSDAELADGNPEQREMADGTRQARIGSMTYRYDPEQLEQTDSEITVPPDYERTIRGTKLLAAERAATVGQPGCTYGESGRTSTCEASKEAGVAFARLDGTLADWRARFDDAGLGEAVEEIAIDEREGFAFTAEAGGSGNRYHFLPDEGRTLLVTRAFRFGRDEGVEALDAVIDSLSFTDG